jgi:KDO2-lipid IV(A) lauroyltransferase
MPLQIRLLDATIALLLQYVLRYRRTIITMNLQDSFHYATTRELSADIKANYLYMAKLLRQIVVKPGKQLLLRRLNMRPELLLDQWLMEGRSVIVTFGHMGNWEWTGSFLGIKYPDQVCALYKKIKSPRINKLMYRRRLSHVNYLIENKQMGDLIRLIQTKPLLILMIADQNPGSSKGMLWVPFMGRETAFVSGPENLALRYQLPVVYVHSAPRLDGGYDLTCKPLYDGKEKVEPGEIMKRYAGMLEENIKAFRPQWLWSHKRWKRNKHREGD